MDAQMQDDLKQFFKHCYSRLEAGEQTKGESYKDADLFQEISEELMDLANYAFLEFVKIQRLREKAQGLK